MPRDGGTVTAYAFPGLDSVLWRSGTRAPALQRVIAFGADDGYLAAVDLRGSPVRVDLRLGAVARSRDSLLASTTSADGAAIYALTPDGALTRFAPSGGDWQFTPSQPVSALLAQADGSLIVAGAKGDRVVVWRVRPPGEEIVDTISYEVGGDAAANAATIAATAGSIGDRVFFGANESVIAVRSRDMQTALELDLGERITSLAATPSGDRLFAALAGDRSVRVVDRFEERVSGKIRLPSEPRALRMDALGRFLLAQGAGDTVYVVSLANDAVIGSVNTEWRGDLPLVLSDGSIALGRGDDVVMAAPGTLADGRVIERGGRDFWYEMRWNGFRPRAAGLDQPVEFRRSAPRDTFDTAIDSDSGSAADSLARSGRVGGAPTGGVPAGVAPPGTEPPVGPPGAKAAEPTVFTLSFAAVQSEKMAREVAARIRVEGRTPRITTADRDGSTLYRVVMGPFSSRAEADRIGKLSGQSYWIFEGMP